jgi:hypothetical protein
MAKKKTTNAVPKRTMLVWESTNEGGTVQVLQNTNKRSKFYAQFKYREMVKGRDIGSGEWVHNLKDVKDVLKSKHTIHNKIIGVHVYLERCMKEKTIKTISRV